MSIFNDKSLKGVADAVSKIMEASKKEEDKFHNKLDKLVHKTFGHSSDEMKKEEKELSPKQKAIAKLDHPKHKIDAGDLAKLRAGHKPVKEEAEQLDELSKDTINSYKDKAMKTPAKNNWLSRVKGIGSASERLKKEEAEQLDELSKSTLGSYVNKADDSVRKLASTSVVGAKPEEKQKIYDKINKKIDKRLSGMSNAVKKMSVKEEVEELDELSKETLGSYVKRAAASGVSHGRSAGVELGVGSGKRKEMYNKEEDKAEKRLSGIRKATDRLTKEEKESCEDEAEEAVEKHEKKMHGKKGEVAKHEKEMHKESFTSLIESYKKEGLKSLSKMKKEEVDNETYEKEMKDQKDKFDGKKKGGDVAKASVQAVKVEEEIELDEAEKMKGEDPCWKDYEMVGHKMKNGKKVPNCVPKNEEVETKKHPFVAVHAKKGTHETHGSTSYEAAQNAAKHWKMKNTAGIDVYRADKKHIPEEVEELDEESKSISMNHYDKSKWHSEKSKDNKIPVEKRIAHADAAKFHMNAYAHYLGASRSDDDKTKQTIQMKKAKNQAEAAKRIEQQHGLIEQVEELDEAKKIISKHGDGVHTAKVYRDPEYNEYQVHYFKNGKHMGEDPVSYHDDKEDAQSTAEHEVKRMNARVNENLEERTLTEPETKKKEEIVKSMKKNLKGFKERYGERGKQVLYATATARAKESA